jgi:hypothetical protein
MSTGDHFAPPQLHTRGEQDDLKTLIEARKIQRDARRHAAAMEHGRKIRAALKEPQAKSARKIRNPLYSKALDHTGANDGNQGKTQNATGLPQTGHAGDLNESP